jgi:hypothetical protein
MTSPSAPEPGCSALGRKPRSLLPKLARRYLSAGLAALAVVFTGGAVVVATPIPAAAVLGSRPLISYNMQGANSGQDSKWTTIIGGYIQQTEVVALQEVGSTPPGTLVANIPLDVAGLPAFGRANYVQHHRWQFGFAGYEVYFLQTDPNGTDADGNPTYIGGRNNIALVTQRAADEVTAIPNPVAGGRAALGVRFGDTWYFSFHARSLGGTRNESADMISAVDDLVINRGLNENWVVLGDFNRAPGDLRADLDQDFLPGTIYAALDGNGNPLPTQQSGHALDYAVASEAVNGTMADRLAGASSDHYAFALGQLRGGAEPNLRYETDRAVEGMEAGGVLDAFHEQTGNNTNIISYHRKGGDNQAWSLDFYNDNSIRFRGRASQRCIDIRDSDTAVAGRPLVLWDCSNQVSQRWYPIAAGDSEIQLRSLFLPYLCMDVEGAPTTPDAGNVIVWPCHVASNERWLFTPADEAITDNPTPIDMSANYTLPSTIENMRAGGVLDAFHARTENNTDIISYHRTGAANQGWNLNWITASTLTIQGVGSNRCIDVHNSNTITAGRELVLFDCTGQASQVWMVEQLADGQVSLRNGSHPDLCMDIGGAPPTPDAGQLIVWHCTGLANQEFMFTSFDPTGTPEPEQAEY